MNPVFKPKDKPGDVVEVVKHLSRHGPVYALVGLFIHRLPYIVGACGALVTAAVTVRYFGLL